MKYTNRSVVPSYLGSKVVGTTTQTPLQAGTVQLLQGEIKEIIPANSEKSLSKKYLEYHVDVQYREGSGPTATTRFPNCLLINHLAGVADKSHFTLRVDGREPNVDSGEFSTTGAKVLLLCLHGNATQSYIIGGIREDTGGDTGDHQYFFEFNGIQQTINADGELQIRYRGATKVNGELTDEADPEAEGSTLTFTKDGSIKLYTKDENQFIHLNHTDKKLEILADTELNVNVNGVAALTAGDSINIHTDTGCSIEARDNILMTSSGVMVGDATDAWLLANKYRNAETRMLKQLSVSLNTLQGLITAAAISLTAAAAANALPTVGGGLAATPFAAAGIALNACAPIFSSMSAAIESFEAQAATYLSPKNKND